MNRYDELKSLLRSAGGRKCELIPVNITPEMAKGFLSFGVTMGGDVDQSVIDDYAQTMRDGEWKPGSILIFSEDHRIIDGYYRLAAVAQSGVAATFQLVRVPNNIV